MEKLKKLKYTFRSFCDKIKNIKSDVDFYRELLEKPQGRAAVAHIKTQLVYLLKKIRPKKIEGRIVFGTGDPASTGQLTGLIAVFYGFYPEKLQITPDFEEKRIEGKLQVKGKLRLIHLLIIVLRLVADRNIRYCIKKIQSKEDINDERK